MALLIHTYSHIDGHNNKTLGLHLALNRADVKVVAQGSCRQTAFWSQNRVSK